MSSDEVGDNKGMGSPHFPTTSTSVAKSSYALRNKGKTLKEMLSKGAPNSKRTLPSPEEKEPRKVIVIDRNSPSSPAIMNGPSQSVNETGADKHHSSNKDQTPVNSNPVPSTAEPEQQTPNKWQELISMLEELHLSAVDQQLATDTINLISKCLTFAQHNNPAQMTQGTQTMTARETARQRWREKIDEANTNQQHTLIDEEWPREAYDRTKLTGGTLIHQPGTTSLVIINRDDIKSDFGQKVSRCLPALQRLDTDSIDELTTISQTDCINGIKETVTTTFILLAPTEDDPGALLQNLKLIKEKAPINTLFTTQISPNILQTARKGLEMIFNRTGTSFEIISDPINPYLKRNRDETQTVTIAPGSLSYADLLKTVKKNIRNEEVGVKVLNAQKTSDGNLQLRVRGQADALAQKITQTIPGVITTQRRGLAILHLKDLEEEVTKEEIVEGIRISLNHPQNLTDILVTSIRPAYNNSCKATIKVPADAAKRLHEKKHIQIGLVSARIWIREDKPRCAKCFREGHSLQQCTGEDRRNRCFNCGEEGHKKASCTKSK